jgi:hypothetical protein
MKAYSAELKEKEAKLFMGKDESEIAARITRIGEKLGGHEQYVHLDVVDQFLGNHGISNSYPSLADTILAQFHGNVERFGEKAYPLSEKQVAAIARQFHTAFQVWENMQSK